MNEIVKASNLATMNITSKIGNEYGILLKSSPLRRETSIFFGNHIPAKGKPFDRYAGHHKSEIVCY